MSLIREGMNGTPSRGSPKTRRSTRRRRAGGLLDLALVVMVAYAMGSRTPVGGLTWFAMETLRGNDADLPSLTAYFSGGAAALPLFDALPNLPAIEDGSETGFPEPWRTAARTVLASHDTPTSLSKQGDPIPPVEQALAGLDDAYALTGHPEAALELFAIGPELQNRAIARSKAAGDAQATRYAVHRRYLPEAHKHRADLLVTSTMALATALDLHWPIAIPHRVTSNWGPRIHPVLKKKLFHNGVDLSVPVGTPLLAAQDGEVVVVGSDDRSGNYVVIDHGHGVRTSYCHLSEIPVAQGQVVHKGQEFAKSGNTGRSTGPHLHFVVRIAGDTVDPLRFRKPAPET
jgi:murein DD-endopeptidase MepM/ murein hydrolase activator NlpD